MNILVDADSCPRQARELILRRSKGIGGTVIFAANRPIPGIGGKGTVMECCPPGENAADDRIMALACPGDLVITRDIPLANRLVSASVAVMDDRGRIYTEENIRERLSLRDFMVHIAENGLGIERTAHYGARELKTFADSLDRLLTRLAREQASGGLRLPVQDRGSEFA